AALLKSQFNNCEKKKPLWTNETKVFALALYKRGPKYCSLIFDEVLLSQNITYCKLTDQFVGYVDMGSLGRQNILANHALVFMVHGLSSSWRQPLAYYFTRDIVKTDDLKHLVNEIIEA
ncbi:hypothetical protein BDFB_013166, partial [Asbolus verrucosus]